MLCRLLIPLALVALAGCTTAPVPPTAAPNISAGTSAVVPSDGVLLTTLGFRFAPPDLSLPADAAISEQVDQSNTVVAVLTAPSGLEVAAYLRRTLPAAGWTITADGNNSLLFERGSQRGAFTVTGARAALAIRYDETS